MKTCTSSYSYNFSWEVVNNYYDVHTRETSFIAFYWHWTMSDIVKVFSKDQKAWNRYKSLVKLVEKELTLHPMPPGTPMQRVHAGASRIAYQFYILTGKIIPPLTSDLHLCSTMREKYYTKYGNIVALYKKPLTRMD
jgi:hypothetical protein